MRRSSSASQRTDSTTRSAGRTTVSRLFIRGYCDTPSASPGQAVRFFVSTDEPTTYHAQLVRLRYAGTRATDPRAMPRVTDGEHVDYIAFEDVEAGINGE